MISTLALALSLLVPSAAPHLYFEQTTLVYVDGQAAGPGVRSRAWHAGQRMRLEADDGTGGPALVLQLDRGRAWRLDPETRTAVELDGKRLRARSQSDAALAGSLMGGGEEGAVRTTPLEGVRTIAGYECRGFRLVGPSVQMVVWVAEGLPVGVEAFTDFLEWSGASRSLGGLLAEIRALPGFPLRTHTRVEALGETRETVSTVTDIRLGPQPAELFEVPRGWRVETEGRKMPPANGGPE